MLTSLGLALAGAGFLGLMALFLRRDSRPDPQPDYAGQHRAGDLVPVPANWWPTIGARLIAELVDATIPLEVVTDDS